MSILRTETNADLIVEMTFADETTRRYTLPDVDPQIDTSTVKQKVQAINNNTATNVQDFRNTFVSKDGSTFSAITAVTLSVTTDEILYSSNY